MKIKLSTDRKELEDKIKKRIKEIDREISYWSKKGKNTDPGDFRKLGNAIHALQIERRVRQELSDLLCK